MTDRPREFTGTAVITWPSPGPGGVLHGWRVELTDALTGRVLPGVTGVTVHLHADAQDMVWADLEMLAGEDGRPLGDGTPVLRNGEVVTERFAFLVSEMRVAGA